MDALNRLQSHAPEFLVWLHNLQVLSTEDKFHLIFATVLAGLLTLYTLKYLLVFILRLFSLSSPLLFAFLPRLPWRGLFRLKTHVSRWHEIIFKAGRYSSSSFASPFAAMACEYDTHLKIPLGRVWLWGISTYQIVGLANDRHGIIVGATGAGKSNLLKTIIGSWRGSMAIIDSKTEMEATFSEHDTSRQWVKIKPYSHDTDGINPLDIIKYAYKFHGESMAVRAAYVIANSLCETPPDAKQPYFTQASSGMIVGLLLFSIAHLSEECHTMGFIRRLIVRGLEVFNEDGSLESTHEEAKELLYMQMRESTAFSGAIYGAAAAFVDASAETRGNLESTLSERTRIFDIKGVLKSTSKTTRPLHELKSCDDYVLSIGASVQSIRGELKDFFKLIINLILFVFEITPKMNGRTLLLGEEFNSLGYNGSFEVAVNIIRSMGLNAILVIQDVEALKAAYKDTWRSFLGNSSFVVWLGTNHSDNLKEINRILGKTTHIETDHHTGKQSFREVEVMTEQQIAKFLSPESGNAIITRLGASALRVKTLKHFEDLPVTCYAPDPDHKEPLLKRFSRFVLSPLISWRKHKALQRQNHYLKPQTPSQETEQ